MANPGQAAYQLTYTQAQEQLQVVATQLSNLVDIQNYLIQEARRQGIAVSTTGMVPVTAGVTSIPTDIMVPGYVSNAHTRSLSLKLDSLNSNTLTASPTSDPTTAVTSYSSPSYSLIPKLAFSDPTVTDNPIDNEIQFATAQLTLPLLEHNKKLIRADYLLKLSRYSEEDTRNQLALVNQAIVNTIALQQQLNQMYGAAGQVCDVNLVNDSQTVASQQQAAAQAVTVNTSQSKDIAAQKSNGYNPFSDDTWPQLSSQTTQLFVAKFTNFADISIPPVYLKGEHPQNSITIPQRWFLASMLASGQIVSFPTVITAGSSGTARSQAAQSN